MTSRRLPCCAAEVGLDHENYSQNNLNNKQTEYYYYCGLLKNNVLLQTVRMTPRVNRIVCNFLIIIIYLYVYTYIQSGKTSPNFRSR